MMSTTMKHVDLTEVTVSEGKKYNSHRGNECIMESIKCTIMAKNSEIVISIEINV